MELKTNEIINMDCLTGLKNLPDGCIDCCVTSPPYYAMRDYGIDGQIGLEATPDEYIVSLVDVFREVRRVLRNDGVLFVNIADSYWGGGWRGAGLSEHSGDIQKGSKGTHCGKTLPKLKGNTIGIKDKDLIGIPWMLAFALRADGWYLRQDIIWEKGNPMVENVTDRCTRSHEYIFLLSKSKKYYFDYKAIMERAVGENEYRNKRSVWTVNVKPYKAAHFAMYPEKLIVDCIKSGSRENGIVLDPFMGGGTTAVVARKLNRQYIGFELNPEYVKIANERIRNEIGLMLW